MPTTATLLTQGAAAIEREERRRCIPRGEGLSSDRSTFLRSPVKTFGRFSVRGPAAWRKDGGTGENSNTMYGACKDLPYELWLVCHHHKGAAESRMCRSVLTCQPTLLPSGACRTRRGCDSSGPRDVFLRGSRAARGGTGRVQPRLHSDCGRGRAPGTDTGDRPSRHHIGDS